MRKSSEAFKEQIYKPIRKTKGRIIFSFSDTKAKEGIKLIEIPPESIISKPLQVVDDIRTGVGKVATFEPNYWKLDGSFLLPLPANETESQYGIRGKELSNDIKIFNNFQNLKFQFKNIIDAIGITITFDTDTNNYCEDFNIIYYDNKNQVVDRFEVRGNNKAVYSAQKQVKEILYMKFEFLKTNIKNRSLRIIEIDFGINLIFDNDNLFSIDLIDEIDINNKTSPMNQLNFTAYNNGDFDFTKPDSFDQFLQKRQEMIYQHGLVLDNGTTEWVDMGKYYLFDWNIRAYEISMTARTTEYLLQQTFYKKSVFTEIISIYDFLVDIFKDAEIENYVIDQSLKNIKVNKYVGNITHREAIRYICQASSCLFTVQNDVAYIERINIPAEIPKVFNITYSDAIMNFPKTKNLSYFNTIEFTVRTFAEVATVNNRPLLTLKASIDNPQEALLFPTEFQVHKKSKSTFTKLSGDVRLNKETIYTDFVELNLVGRGEFEYKLEGTTVNVLTHKEAYVNPTKIPQEPTYIYKSDTPLYIESETWEANKPNIGNEIFNILKYRLKSELTIRGNPLLETTDYLETQISNRNKKPIKSITTKTTLNYNVGALESFTETLAESEVK